MKTSKRILSLLLCIVMLVSMVPTAVFANEAAIDYEEAEYAAETAEEEIIAADETAVEEFITSEETPENEIIAAEGTDVPDAIENEEVTGQEPAATENEEITEPEPAETEDIVVTPEDEEHVEADDETVLEVEISEDALLAAADDNYNGCMFDGDFLYIRESVYSESYGNTGIFEDYCLDVLNHYKNYSGNIDLCFSGQDEIEISADLWNGMKNFISSDGSLYVNREYASGTPRWVFENPETTSEDVVLSVPTVRDEGEKLFFKFATTQHPAAKWRYSFGEEISENSDLQYEDRLSVYSLDGEVVSDTLAFSLGVDISHNVLAPNQEYYIAASPALKRYNNKDEIYALVRDTIVNREKNDEDSNWVELTVYLENGMSDPDFEDILDFYRERDGIRGYEGDYLRNTLQGYSIIIDYDRWTFSALPITTREQEDNVDAKVAQILASSAFQTAIDSGSNETMAHAAFNWVVNNVKGSGFDRYKPINHTGYSAFIQGYGTCEAMAVAFYRLCREMGVPCRVIMGTDSGAHTYTIIRLDDGCWYYADPSANIWKKDYTSFKRATEQEQYRSSLFVRNYLSKVKGYTGAGAAVADILDADGQIVSSEASLLDAQTFLTERIGADKAAGINVAYTVRLKKDLTIISSTELNYNEFGDYSDRVTVDLGGHKLSTLNRGDYYICVRELKNGKISMPTDSWVEIMAGSGYLNEKAGGPYTDPYLVSNVDFVGVDGSKKQLTSTDALLVSSGVKIASDCSVTGIPYIHLESGAEFDCSASVYALETHSSMSGMPNYGDIILGGNLTVATWMDYGSYGNRTVINNLTVTTGSKLNTGAEYIVNGSLNLKGRTYIYDANSYWNVRDDNRYTAVYEYRDDSDNSPISICPAKVESTVSISGILDAYMLGEISEAPVRFSPINGNYNPGSRVAAVSAKGILYKNRKTEKAITSENCSEYFSAKAAPGKIAYPAIENGVLILEAPSKTLAFDANGGYCEIESKKYYLDSEYGTLPQPLKENCSFIGWFTEDGEQIFDDTKTPVDAGELEDLTLYAHWEMNAEVAAPEFYSGGEQLADGAQLKHGAEITIKSETPGAAIYYTTDGTTPGESNGIRYVEPFTVESGEVTLKAFAVREGYKDSTVIEIDVFVSDGAENYGTLTDEDMLALEADGKTALDIPEGLWIAGVPEEVQFRGSAIKIETLRVYHHNMLLREGTDYTVKYSNNTNAGTAKITISGKGNYSGSRVVTFMISPLSLGDATSGNSDNLILTDVTLVANGKMQKGTTTAVYRVDPDSAVYTALKAGKDFAYSYSDGGSDYMSSGKHTVYINGIGNYAGTASFTEEIVEKAAVTLITGLKFTVPKTVDATGAPLCPEITVYDPVKKEYLECGEDKDFTVSYFNNILPGTATAVIKGHGVYSGSKTVSFKIAAIKITKAALETPLSDQPYTGSAQTQSGYSLVYKYKSGTEYVTEKLTEGVDYRVNYTNNINAGKNKAAIIFTGIGRFSGTLKKTFTIVQCELSSAAMTLSEIGEVIYTKGGTKPALTLEYNGMTLKEGTDYTLKYSNNSAVGNTVKLPTVVITGKGNYKGTLTKQFTIIGSSLNNCKGTANDFAYTGKVGVSSPKVTIYDSDGAKLAAGTDYSKSIVYIYAEDSRITRVVNKVKKTIVVTAGTEVDVKNDIISAGTELAAIVTGINNYADSQITVPFRCASYSVSKAKVTLLNTKGYTYSGAEIRPNKNAITVSMNNVPLEKSDYEIISYEANIAKGTAKLTIRGVGDYCGTKTITFKINAKAVN